MMAEKPLYQRRAGERVIALAGNPNVGKSTVFNALTGLKQHTGNWAGKTVGCAAGRHSHNTCNYIVVDLPGTYSMGAHSPEEEVARDFITSGQADAVVVVCDASNPERGLVLTLQTLALTPRVVVCLNLSDEAAKRGIYTNAHMLSERLGVPVVASSARRREGLGALMAAVESVIASPPSPIGIPGNNLVNHAERLCDGIITRNSVTYDTRDRKLDRVLTGRLTGIPVMLLVLLGVLWFTVWGANYPSEALGAAFSYIENAMQNALSSINCPMWLTSLITEGLFRTLAWVVSVMLPPMAIFFPLFTLLEDFGYLPRVAFNLDRRFERARACGKQALCMCMGLGCNAAGVVGCRIIDSPRERMVAILTNNFIPCNGRFPALITLAAIFFAGAVGGVTGSLASALMLCGFITLGVMSTFGISRLLSATLLKGLPSAFTLELPPYRRPQFGKVLVRSVLDRTLFVLGRAAAVAAPAGALIWALANISVGDVSLLIRLSGFLDPFGRLLGLDGVIILAFLLGFPANEIVIPIIVMTYMRGGALIELAGLSELGTLLTSNGWTWVTALCFMLFSLFHFPCSTTLWTIKKETDSIGWTVISALLPTVCGVIACIVVASTAKLFGI